MSINIVYSAVLTVVLSAWFGNVTTKKAAPQKKQKENCTQVQSAVPQATNSILGAAQIVTDPHTLGIKPNQWIDGGKCNIEYINGSLMSSKVHPITKDRVLKLTGWAMDIEKERLPKQVVVRFTDSAQADFYAVSQAGLVRNDVRAYFELPNRLSTSGFELVSDIHGIAAGEYALTLLIQFEDATYLCSNGRKIKV